MVAPVIYAVASSFCAVFLLTGTGGALGVVCSIRAHDKLFGKETGL